jgi:hypothetical protein
MRWSALQLVRVVTAVVVMMALVTVTSANSWAQAQAEAPATHVVSPAEMQNAAAQATSTRQAEENTLNDFLSSPQASEAMQSAHVDPTQVKGAISGLNDDDLAKLSVRAQSAQADFAAGRISDRALIFIVLAIVVVILLIVLFH